MKPILNIIFILLASVLTTQPIHAAGVGVDPNLRLTFPYVEYQGQRYHAILDYAPEIPGGDFWKFNSLSPTNAAGFCGGKVDPDLNVTDICAMYAGRQYSASLDVYNNPVDPAGLYWKLAQLEQLPCTLTQVTGPNQVCYDPSEIINTIFPCIANCGEDANCLVGCIGGAFQLAVQFTNSSQTAINCSIPAGTTFISDSEGVQNMMVLYEEPFNIPAGQSKTYCITTYCLNSERSAPAEEDNYSTGGVVTLPCLTEILSLTYGKQLTGTKQSAIQQIVWECTDSGMLSQVDREYLQNL